MSTSGIDKLKDNKFKYALKFEDNTCPYCGGRLYIDTRASKNNITSTRFKCDRCDFVCPLKYEGDEVTPVYDDSISKFIESFGEVDRYKFVRRWENILYERRNNNC